MFGESLVLLSTQKKQAVTTQIKEYDRHVSRQLTSEIQLYMNVYTPNIL